MAFQKKLKYTDLVRQLKADKNYPVYFFTEDENFLKDKALVILKKKFILQNYKDFNYFIFYGKETSARKVIEELQSPPVLSPKKLVILKDFHSLQQNDKKQILNYVEKPVQDSILVIETGKVNLRAGFYAKLIKKVPTYYFYHAYNAEAAIKFLRTEANKYKKQISPGAADLLIDLIGFDLLQLNNEFEKLILYIQDKTHIIKEDVEKCVGIFKKNSIFDLQDSLVNKDIKKSIKILHNLLENGTKDVFIIIMLTNFFKTLWRINILRTQKKLSQPDIENCIKGFYIRKIINQSYQFSLNKYPIIFNILLETDKKLKSLSINSRTILELMIYKICFDV